MRILALDLSVSCTGWAYSDSGLCIESSGVQSFKGRRGDSPGMRWLEFKAWLNRVIDIVLIVDLIVYEQAHHRGGAATHAAHGLIACVEEVAAVRKIEVTARHTGEIKKHAKGDGKGKANKLMMVRNAARRWPNLKIIDDNHADALWLLDLVREELDDVGTDSDSELPKA